MSKPCLFAAAALLLAVAATGPAAAQNGPVAQACKAEIAKLCADKQHGAGEIRACLQSHREKLSTACKQALDTTGPGRGPRSRR